MVNKSLRQREGPCEAADCTAARCLLKMQWSPTVEDGYTLVLVSSHQGPFSVNATDNVNAH